MPECLCQGRLVCTGAVYCFGFYSSCSTDWGPATRPSQSQLPLTSTGPNPKQVPTAPSHWLRTYSALGFIDKTGRVTDTVSTVCQLPHCTAQVRGQRRGSLQAAAVLPASPVAFPVVVLWHFADHARMQKQRHRSVSACSLLEPGLHQTWAVNARPQLETIPRWLGKPTSPMLHSARPRELPDSWISLSRLWMWCSLQQGVD